VTRMACDMRTQILSAISLGLFILPVGAGCTVWHDLGHRPADPALAIPHHNYMPRCTQVACMDPAFYGYHPTCWSEWPEAWSACPPPAMAAEIGAEMGDVDAGFPTLAPEDAAAEPPIPPAPKPADWDQVPVPKEAPSEAASPPEGASLPPSGGVKPKLAPAPSGGGSPLSDEPATPAAHDRPEQPAEAPEAEPLAPGAQGPQSRLESDADESSNVIQLMSAAQDDATPGHSDWLLWVEEHDPVQADQEPADRREDPSADPSRHLDDQSADQDGQDGWIIVEAR
jgi:hypothetical protein